MDDITADAGEPLFQITTVFRRHSKGPVMFNGCSPSGEVIIIDNISPSRSYELTGWYIERQTDSQALLRYTFTDALILAPLTSVELWSSSSVPPDTGTHPSSSDSQQQSFVRLRLKLLTWNTARQWSINRLFDRNGRDRAIFSHRTLTPDEVDKDE